MNENEIIRNEEVGMEPEVNEVSEERTKSNFGLGVVLGGLAVAGIYAASKQIKKQITKHKARKGGVVDTDYEEVKETESNNESKNHDESEENSK